MLSIQELHSFPTYTNKNVSIIYSAPASSFDICALYIQFCTKPLDAEDFLVKKKR